MSKLCPFKQPPRAACVEESCPLWDLGLGCAFLAIAVYLADISNAAEDVRCKKEAQE